MRLFRCVAGLITILTLALPAYGAPASPAAAVGSSWAWTESAYTSVFSDSLPTADAGQTLRLDTARNEYEAGQLVVRRPDAFRIDQVAFTDLVSGANRIAAANLEYKFVENTYLDANTTEGGNPVTPVTRQAPADFPDGLSNDATRSVPARTTQPIWIRVYVPATTPGGLYNGTATVRTTAGDQAVPVQVDVRPVTLPEASDGAFTNTLWSLMFGVLDTGDLGGREPVEDAFGQQKYSPGWWALMGNLAKEWKAHRTNNLTIPVMRMLMDGGSHWDAGTGRYVFNWQHFDDIVDFFLARGGVKRIEGFLVSGPHDDPDHWSIELIDPATNQPAWESWNTAKAGRWLDQYTAALRAHLEAKGWASRFWTHVGDEPSDQVAVDSWTGIAKRMRAAWPAIKLGDAVYAEPWAAQVAAQADIVEPNLRNYTANPVPYDKLRAGGKELWFYNCSIPTGNFLNRFIDQPQWDQRQTLWLAYSRGATGYLHWAMDKWWYPLNDDDGDGQDFQEQKGDGYIVLPDREHQTIRSTVRYESLRDGIEDYEVLNLLGKTDPVAAHDLAAGLVTDAETYTPDTSSMIRVRRLMLDLAAGRPATDVARAAVATASSGNAQAAIDGDPATAWQPSGSGWLQLDFGKQVQLDAIRLRWSGAVPASVQLSQSYDGSHWATLRSSTGVTTPDSKARYLRVQTSSALSAIEVAGAALAAPNLAGGRAYTWSETPRDVVTGREATDGVPAGSSDDRLSVGFEYGDVGARRTVSLDLDLGAVQSIDHARTHAYEEFPPYRPDEVRVLTSVDGTRFTSRAAQSTPRGTAGIWYDLTFGAVQARYVRFEFTKTGTADGDSMFLDDVEVYAAAPGTPADLAWGRPVYRNAEPSAAYPDSGQESTDGVGGGRYDDGLSYGYPLGAGETKTVDVEVDLGAAKPFNHVRVAAYDDGEHDYAPDRVQIVVAGNVVAEATVPAGGWYDLSFPTVTHDGVVVRMTKTEGRFADYLFVGEIIVQGDLGPDLVRSYQAPAGGYPDSGSESSDGILAAGYADGLSYGYPVSGQRSVSIVLDLGTVQSVSLVKVREYADDEHDYAPSEVVVATSTDGTAYTERARSSTAVGRWYELAFAPVSARFVKLTLTKTSAANADWLFVDELTVHARQ
ncbi:glycoside hydrolase domain-containing protein [Kribbella sp. NPDC026611]|uniref:glycoside hydrolase domain-containing protein n=1 Tax=Kribbella sp. NPDC026611 TaxID=3154911 RepID=UPI0033F3A899